MDVDALGLDELDRSLLRAIIEMYNGGPVGLETLAAALGEEAVTLEDLCEPYLMQMGFLTRTPRGRCATRFLFRPGERLPGGQRPADPVLRGKEDAYAPADKSYELLDATGGNRLERGATDATVCPRPAWWLKKSPPPPYLNRQVSPPSSPCRAKLPAARSPAKTRRSAVWPTSPSAWRHCAKFVAACDGAATPTTHHHGPPSHGRGLAVASFGAWKTASTTRQCGAELRRFLCRQQLHHRPVAAVMEYMLSTRRHVRFGGKTSCDDGLGPVRRRSGGATAIWEE